MSDEKKNDIWEKGSTLLNDTELKTLLEIEKLLFSPKNVVKSGLNQRNQFVLCAHCSPLIAQF